MLRHAGRATTNRRTRNKKLKETRVNTWQCRINVYEKYGNGVIQMEIYKERKSNIIREWNVDCSYEETASKLDVRIKMRQN